MTTYFSVLTQPTNSVFPFPDDLVVSKPNTTADIPKFFGISFTDGTIQVYVLESVQEHLEEGVSMHHCVFDNAYYLKENSLILSATIEGKRIETIEVSLRTLEVVQSRGVCNKNTEYHEQIVNLVNANRRLIRQRIKTTA